ncbi:MAG: mechanosensitive ion channel [Armatimonadia bacterium]|nr:mechanosensitive ion channel [Armatimonadia bacterium]
MRSASVVTLIALATALAVVAAAQEGGQSGSPAPKPPAGASSGGGGQGGATAPAQPPGPSGGGAGDAGSGEGAAGAGPSGSGEGGPTQPTGDDGGPATDGSEGEATAEAPEGEGGAEDAGQTDGEDGAETGTEEGEGAAEGEGDEAADSDQEDGDPTQPRRPDTTPSGQPRRGLGIQMRQVDIQLDLGDEDIPEGEIAEDTEARVQQAENIREQVAGLRTSFETDVNLAIATVRGLEDEVMDVNQAITQAARVPTQVRKGRMSEGQAREEISGLTDVSPRLREILDELDAKEQDAADLRLYYDSTLRELQAKRDRFAAATQTYQALSDSIDALDEILADVDRLAETIDRTRAAAREAIDQIGQVAADIDAAIRESQAQALRERVEAGLRIDRATPRELWTSVRSIPSEAAELGRSIVSGLTGRGALGYALMAAALIMLVGGLSFRRPVADRALQVFGGDEAWRAERLSQTATAVGGLAVMLGVGLFGVACQLVSSEGLWLVLSGIGGGAVYFVCGIGAAILVGQDHGEVGQRALARSRMLLIVLAAGMPAMRYVWRNEDVPHDVSVVAVTAYALLVLAMLTHALLRDTTPFHVFAPDSLGRRLQRAVKPLAALVAVAGLACAVALVLGYENMAAFVGRAVPLSLVWVVGAIVLYRALRYFDLRIGKWLQPDLSEGALVRRTRVLLVAIALTIIAIVIRPVFYAWKLFLFADYGFSLLIIAAAAMWAAALLAQIVWPRAVRTVYPADQIETTEEKIVDLMEEPLGILLFALFVHLVPQAIRLPVDLGGQATTWAAWIAGLGATVLLMRGVDLGVFLMTRQQSEEPSTFYDQLLPMLRKVANTIIVIFAIILGAQKAGLNVTALLGGLGVGGLAVALAGQETIANIFGAAMIFVDRPFKVGDWILVGDVEGTVEEIGLRSTRIRTFGKTLITMPNAELANKTIDNFSQMPVRRVKMYLGLSYETSAADMDAAMRAFNEILETHPEVWQDFKLVAFTDFGGSSLDVMIYYFTHTTVWAEYLRIRGEVNMMFMEAIDRLGLEIAFPTSTLYMRPDERPSPHFKGKRPQRNERQEVGEEAGRKALDYIRANGADDDVIDALSKTEDPVLGELDEDDDGGDGR